MKNSLILLFLLSWQSLVAQKTSVEAGFGIGGVLEVESFARGMLFVHGQIQLSDNFQGGLEFSTGGNLLPLGTTEERIDSAIVSPYSLRRNTAILTGRYSFKKTSIGTPFIGVGVGLNTFKQYVHSIDTKQVSQHSLTGIIQAGVVLDAGISVAMRYHTKAKSPGFRGLDDTSRVIFLDQKKVSTLLITLGVRIK